MKYIAKLVEDFRQEIEIEVEADSQEEAEKIFSTEDDDIIWHDVHRRIQEDFHPVAYGISLVMLEEKSVHDERVKKEHEKLERDKSELPF